VDWLASVWNWVCDFSRSDWILMLGGALLFTRVDIGLAQVVGELRALRGAVERSERDRQGTKAD
jgi:hypothetical protein